MLTKQPIVTFVPGTPGQPYAPASSWCAPAPTNPGTWEYSCVDYPLNTNSSILLPPGSIVYYDEANNGFIRVCASHWVPGTGEVASPVCYDTPEQPYIPSVPSRHDVTPDYGWNAGANSIDQIDGDLRVAFTMDAAIGLGVGFVTDLESIGTIDRILYGFYFHMTMTGTTLFNVIEGGKIIGEPTEYETGDAFEIQRGNGAVSFWHAGAMLRTSRVPSSGPLNVGSAVYASGDTI